MSKTLQSAVHRLEVNCAPSVRCDDRGNAEPLDPPREKRGCAIGGGYVAERNSFRPAGGSVDYREKIGETCRLRKWSHQIHVDVFETAAGYGDGFRS